MERQMIASMHNLDHRLNELRPSEREQETARWVRDAASSRVTVVRTVASPAGQRPGSASIRGQAPRLAAG
jgi:hypothetical protein